jgi:sigma-B regulation protein RsbU (phosphoserine phosphatase)
VEAAGIPLGLLDDSEYDEVTLHGHPGDAFVFFSDGIIDAVNRAGELFGRARVEETVRKNHEKSAEGIVDAIFEAVKKHADGARAFDDETVVAIKLKSASAKPDVSKKSTKKTNPALRNV